MLTHVESDVSVPDMSVILNDNKIDTNIKLSFHTDATGHIISNLFAFIYNQEDAVSIAGLGEGVSFLETSEGNSSDISYAFSGDGENPAAKPAAKILYKGKAQKDNKYLPFIVGGIGNSYWHRRKIRDIIGNKLSFEPATRDVNKADLDWIRRHSSSFYYYGHTGLDNKTGLQCLKTNNWFGKNTFCPTEYPDSNFAPSSNRMFLVFLNTCGSARAEEFQNDDANGQWDHIDDCPDEYKKGYYDSNGNVFLDTCFAPEIKQYILYFNTDAYVGWTGPVKKDEAAHVAEEFFDALNAYVDTNNNCFIPTVGDTVDFIDDLILNDELSATYAMREVNTQHLLLLKVPIGEDIQIDQSKCN